MQRLQATLTTVLCLNLLSPGAPIAAQDFAASNTRHTHNKSAHSVRQLQGDARIEHALNRFTFGLRPDDLSAVKTIGLDKWFQEQLHPATIDQSNLIARLAQFPAMQWSAENLLYRVPSNAIIRQVLAGKLSIPEQGALHSVYENQVYRTQSKIQQQDGKKSSNLQDQQQASAVFPIAKMGADAMKTSRAMDTGLLPMDVKSESRAPTTDVDQSNPASSTTARPPVDAAQIRSILDLAPQQRIARLTAMPPPEFDNFIKSLKARQRAALVTGLTPDLKEIALDLENPQGLVNEELIAQRLTRDIYSDAQLQEVMTDFWFNHFNIFLHKNDEMPYYLVSYERDVIRPHALGKFEDLLEATAHSPAMLLYLDNAGSVGPDSVAAQRAGQRPENKKKAHEGLNENYARELMELHTLGVNGGYTQADVTQVARVLTAWTVDRPQRGGAFKFEPNRHEPGTKIVLGKKIKEHGEEEGRELLHILATRPATAQFIARKLAVRFVSDDPPQAVVDRMAKTFLSSKGDIAAVLNTLFHATEFWDANVYRAKVKTPVEFVVSAVRASNANVDNLQPLANAIREMGMPLYGCVTPNGYNWRSSTWVSTNALVNRMNFALSLATNRLPGVTVHWNRDSPPPNSLMPDPRAEEARLESFLVPGDVSESTRSAVMQQFLEQSVPDVLAHAKARPVGVVARGALKNSATSAFEKQDQLLAGLLLGSPEFQRR